MERAKTAPAPEEAKPEATSSKPAPTSSQERVVDLERRLNDLDSTLENNVTDDQAASVQSHAAATPTAVERKQAAGEHKPPAVDTAGKNNPLLVRLSS